MHRKQLLTVSSLPILLHGQWPLSKSATAEGQQTWNRAGTWAGLDFPRPLSVFTQLHGEIVQRMPPSVEVCKQGHAQHQQQQHHHCQTCLPHNSRFCSHRLVRDGIGAGVSQHAGALLAGRLLDQVPLAVGQSPDASVHSQPARHAGEVGPC